MSLYFRAVVYPWYNTVPGRDDVQRNVSDHAYSTVVMMSKGIFLAMSASVRPAKDRLLASATGLSSAARPRHARPTQQPSVTPAKERGPMTGSASGERRTEPSPVPDMAGERKNMEFLIQYKISPQIQQHVHERTHVLLLCVLLCCRTWVGGSVGGVLYVLLL